MQKQEEILSEEDKQIQQEFEALVQDYLATNHRKKVELITKAFNFANAAHKGIRRRSGEPYIMHPLAVARIVVNEIGMGSTSNAIANMDAVSAKYAYSKTPYFVVPIVGALFIDFINIFIIFGFIGFLQ